MTAIAEKTEHPALGQFNSSLMWRDAIEQGEGTFDYLNSTIFPMPGAPCSVAAMAPHTAVVGSTGSGKTILLKHLMRSVLSADISEGGLRFRAVVYDPKRELFPFLRMMGIPASQIVVTHPFDARSACWDLAADFREPAQIEELAELIVPKSENPGESESALFFETSSRIIVQDVIESLHETQPGSWDLRAVIETLMNQDSLKECLQRTANGRDTWNAYFRPRELDPSDRTSNSLVATLHAYARPFQALASLWYNTDHKFSLDRWHVGSGVLLLGADPRRERTMQRINRLLIRRISQLVLGRDEERPIDLTWFFFDEIREAGKLRGLRQLMTEGRSKGARVVMGFQDIEGLYSLYGDHEAEEMVGLCGNRMILHVDNPKTRKWASDFMGEAEVPDESFSEGETAGRDRSVSTGRQVSLTLRANVLPVEFHSMPLGNPFTGVPIWFSVPGRRNFAQLSPQEAQEAVFLDQQIDERAIVPRPEDEQKRIENQSFNDLPDETMPAAESPPSEASGKPILLGSLSEFLSDVLESDERE
ncbi:MAG: type IV secretion system DNA-binding domain-containing protein [Planctomycetota bacterium]